MVSDDSISALNRGCRQFTDSPETVFQPVRFAVIADCHIDIDEDSIEHIQDAIERLNHVKGLAFVLFNGDLLRDGEVENAEAVRDLLNTLKTEVFVLRGNHDYQPADPQRRKTGVRYLAPDAFISFFKGFGYDKLKKSYYAKQIAPGLRLLALDSCLPDEREKWGGILPAEQLNWLDTQLSSHTGQIHLVFMHHGLIHWNREDREDELKQWYCIDNAGEVRTVLEKNIRATPVAISGHHHISLHNCKLRGINYFTVPPLLPPVPCYTLFTITPEQISWESCDLSSHNCSQGQ
ncbi:metallophosphoesterase family protein [Desulfomarina sp.]